MPEISLPTKANQDVIKLQTDKITDIKSKTDLIGSANPTTADTSTLMNYLKQLENKIANISGGTDWSEYKQLQLSGDITPASNVYSTLLSVTGEGALIYADANGSNSGTQYSGMLRITVDGVIMFHARTNANNSSFVGVRMQENAFGLSLPFVNTSYGTAGYVELYRPIFFKKSLKIESTIAGASVSQSYRIKYLLK